MYFLDNNTDRQILDYLTKSMSSEDIEKSLNRSGLVQVERTVSKPGITPFRQKFWVKPDEVKKTDIVLHGQSKNNATMNATESKPKESKPKISQKTWDSVKELYDTCESDAEFYSLLDDIDIVEGKSWKKSNDPKENLNRAKQALAEYWEQEYGGQESTNLEDIGIKFDPNDIQAQEYLKKIQLHLGNKKTTVKKSKITTVPESTSEYKHISKLIADKWKSDEYSNDMNDQKRGQVNYEILGIYKVSEFPAEKDFNKIVQNNNQYKNETVIGKNCQKDTFFHGTSYEKTGLILGHSGEFKVPKEGTGEIRHGNMLGSGIFLAEVPSKSAGYFTLREGVHDGDEGTLMICEASLGSCLEIEGKPDYWDDEIEEMLNEYDTVVAKESHNSEMYSLNNNEFCVHNPKAIIPKYLVDMRISIKSNKK